MEADAKPQGDAPEMREVKTIKVGKVVMSAEFHSSRCGRLVKGIIFTSVVMPLVYIFLMSLSALVLMAAENCKWNPSFQTMAAALTGGALLLSNDACIPSGTGSKIMMTFLGSWGIGAWGFMVAMLTSLQEWWVTSDPMASGTKIVKKGSLKNNRGRCNLWVGATVLVLCAVILQLFLATFFALILQADGDFNYPTSWRTISWTQLGGGVPYQVGVPNSSLSGTFLCIIGLWAIGWETLIISKVGNAVSEIVGNEYSVKNLKQSVMAFCGFAILFLPASLLLMMCVSGLILVSVLDLSWQACFWITLPSITGGAASVYSLPSDHHFDTGGVAMLIIVSSLSFAYLSICVGIGGLCVDPIVDTLGFGKSENPTVLKGVWKLLLAITIVIPLAVCLVSLPIGGVLAAVEDWDFADGFWWCVAAQLGGGMSLSPGVIQTVGGRFLGVMVTANSIAFSVITIGFSGSPATDHLQQTLWMFMDEMAEKAKEEAVQVKEEAVHVKEEVVGTKKSEESPPAEEAAKISEI